MNTSASFEHWLIQPKEIQFAIWRPRECSSQIAEALPRMFEIEAHVSLQTGGASYLRVNGWVALMQEPVGATLGLSPGLSAPLAKHLDC